MNTPHVYIEAATKVVASLSVIGKDKRTPSESVAYEQALMILATAMAPDRPERVAQWNRAKESHNATWLDKFTAHIKKMTAEVQYSEPRG